MQQFQLRRWHQFLALGFGSGLAPKAPGTFGSLAALPLVALMLLLPLPVYLLITVAACALGIYVCGQTARDINEHDHPAIVWDEFAGMMLTFIAAPLTLSVLVVGFTLFRLFDILKPWPISWCDKQVHGGLGIMLDDVLAGIFACVALQLMMYYWPSLFTFGLA